MLFRNIDLSGIGSIDISAEASPRTADAGGTIELRLDSTDGPLAGTTGKVEPLDIDLREELARLRDAWEKGGQKGPRPGRREVMALFRKTYSLVPSEEHGVHDLYFVFRNPDTKPGQMLMQVNSFTFRNDETPVVAHK